ncbi:hypothetical protein [Fibrobacter sp.]|uniref:hypothetical protein n=1 Tax=Fibrobacter sp. TaxID=35828 RepID=UPI0025C20C48|nr:hypothetical protein [Fibrobacter sp.]MBS7272061.1 hypothetical protein [Fibrobacter sp.]MDD7499256.1 hypothetical protein [Fibrobacter sp.]MDY5725622.1 hypothetical protein [Fibrobacter sp.]
MNLSESLDGGQEPKSRCSNVALDLKITDELRRACVARELVNRIQIPQRRAQRPSLLGHYRAAAVGA